VIQSVTGLLSHTKFIRSRSTLSC